MDCALRYTATYSLTVRFQEKSAAIAFERKVRNNSGSW